MRLGSLLLANLTLMPVGAPPTWPHRSSRGSAPDTVAVVVMALVLMGRS